MTSPYFPQRTQVAVKIEGTEGTDSVPTASDVIAPTYDAEYTPSVEMFERNNTQGSFSRLPQIAGERSGQITFATELKGSGVAGTAPPNLSAPFLACNMGETIVASTSVTYAPVSTGGSSATVELREGSTTTGAKQKKIVGARGTWVLEGVKGSPVLVRFTFTGRYIEPLDTAIVLLTTPAPGPNPEPFLNTSFSFQGVATLKVQTVTLDIGNNVVLRNDANQASGNFSAVITDRSPIGNIDPEQEDQATANFFNDWTTNSEGVLSYVLGATAGNISTVSAPKAQITSIAEADRDGLRTEGLDLQLNQSADAGDDEISIAFT